MRRYTPHLVRSSHEQIEEKTKTSGKVQQLFDVLFDPSYEKDKRETCANNLVALAKERAGEGRGEMIVSGEGITFRWVVWW